MFGLPGELQIIALLSFSGWVYPSGPRMRWWLPAFPAQADGIHYKRDLSLKLSTFGQFLFANGLKWTPSKRYGYLTWQLLPNELETVFKPFREELDCKVLTENPVADAKEVLNSSGVGLFGLTSPTFDHWVLAVGIGCDHGQRSRDVFLILDPALPPLPMLPWNATLTANASRRGWHRYETANGECKVNFTDALLLTPRSEETPLTD
ncbi:hypothetical protein [Dechloromonas sp. ZS-1]|uniref:hypothetical protein n=1 Tax=Dechloromonas sp. ZS-1 TaxID=3138067 RepID=UPI0031FDB035